MRLVTFKELFLEEVNKMLEEEGRDIRVVADRPRPKLVAERGEVVALREERDHGQSS
jgi:hypothetical protein